MCCCLVDIICCRAMSNLVLISKVCNSSASNDLDKHSSTLGLSEHMILLPDDAVQVSYFTLHALMHKEDTKIKWMFRRSVYFHIT